MPLPPDVSPSDIDDAFGTEPQIHFEATAMIGVRADVGVDPADVISLGGFSDMQIVGAETFEEEDGVASHDVAVDIEVGVQGGADAERRAKERVGSDLHVSATDDAVVYCEHHDTEIRGRL